MRKRLIVPAVVVAAAVAAVPAIGATTTTVTLCAPLLLTYSKTVTKTGSYSIVCTIHEPDMKMTLVVTK